MSKASPFFNHEASSACLKCFLPYIIERRPELGITVLMIFGNLLDRQPLQVLVKVNLYVGLYADTVYASAT